jgi:flagellar hook-associated protein 1 FlgK
VTGAAASSGAQTGLRISGWQPGNTITLDFTVNGAPRRLILLPESGSPAPYGSNGPDPSATVLRIDMGGTFSTAASAIQAALAPLGITVNTAAGNTLQFLDDGAGNTTDVTGLSADITMTRFDSGNAELPFFVDSGANNAAFAGNEFAGLAQRLKVNPDLRADPSALVKFASTTPQGDTTRPDFLIKALTTTTRAFQPLSNGGTGPAFVSTVADFTRRLVETQGANAEAAQRLDEGQGIALAAVEARFAEKSGVNIDQEMAQLVLLQNAYGANARVMTAIRDMLDLLMRM